MRKIGHGGLFNLRGMALTERGGPVEHQPRVGDVFAVWVGALAHDRGEPVNRRGHGIAPLIRAFPAGVSSPLL